MVWSSLTWSRNAAFPKDNMKLKMLMGLVVVLSSSMAYAGASWNYPSCVRNTDGSGYCSGSFEAFRKSADSTDYAYFMSSASGWNYFAASLGGVTVSCSPNGSPSVVSIWPQAMANSGGFLIQWNAAATCTHLTLYNASAYQSGW